MSRKQRLEHAGPKKGARKEVLGTLQQEMCEQLDELEEKYPMLRQRKAFWLAAKKIIGDLDRIRVKEMRNNYNKICKNVQHARCGATGAKKRGGEQDRRSSHILLQDQRHQNLQDWSKMAVEIP